MAEYDDDRQPDAPCPAGNRWGLEIDRINVEIRSLRHRANNSEQISALQGAAMKAMEDDIVALKKATFGSNGSPGLMIDVDRLKQRSLGITEARLLWISAIGTLGTLIAALVAVAAFMLGR